jgi:hypothetical protein
MSISDRSPTPNSEIDTMKGILQVKVLYQDEPLSFAWVHFYIDDEHIGVELTDSNGVASKTFELLDDFGDHTWKVRITKRGYDTLWSSKWRFEYRPKPVLTLVSDYGKVYGNGSYAFGENASFGVKPEIINIGEGKRFIFVEWISYHENGYTGNENPSNVTMLNNILEIAVWQTQYYLDMDCELPKAVTPKSGWYDENSILGIHIDSLPGTEFLYWNGSGQVSYSGTDLHNSIKMEGPIKEQALFNRENYSLAILSEYGDFWGSGLYPAWENVSFGVENAYVYLNKGERVKFIEWDSDSNYGFKGNDTTYSVELSEDINQVAIWKKQYFVDVNSSLGGNVTTNSGWIDENTIIILEAKGEENYKFMGWSGVGNASYSGSENNYSVFVTSPITETAEWRKIYKVSVESELPVEGPGEYLDGELVTLSATGSEGLLIRKMFQKWSGDIDSTSNPFSFTINRDMEISAIYIVNYTYFLVLAIFSVIIIGIITYVLVLK